MDAFEIADGAGGQGAGRYADGLLTLADGAVRGIETVARLEIRPPGPGPLRWPGAVAEGLREALPAGGSRPLPLRLALSTVRAGLGAIADGLHPGEAATVAIVFADGAGLTARMAPALAAMLDRDRRLVRAALARAAPPAAPAPPPGPPGPQPELTSIFRYEKRQGRLRRVTAADRKGGEEA